MSASWKSNLPAVKRKIAEAQGKGLQAAAYVLANAVKENLRGGYTTGKFVTGASVNAVTIGPVEPAGDERWRIRVGTNLLYNLYWELGHQNIFTRKHEREERWRPAFVDSRNEMRDAFSRVFKRAMEAAR